ncbi:MAG: ATP-dependent DNA helicase [Frankiaceae bacterium]
MTVRYSPSELACLLGVEAPTAEQEAVIAAPLAPAGVVAGAGSGKTSTMAARVVWLVANGLVASDGVLGLTFTRKAASELSVRVRRRLDDLRARGLLHELGSDGESLDGLPSVSTYHSYAGRLVAEHALREAAEPGARLITPAVQWQLAAAVVGAYAGPMDDVGNGPAWVIDAVLALAGELAEHLRSPAELRAELDRWCARVAAESGRRTSVASKLLDTAAVTRQLLPLVEGYIAAKTRRGVLDYGDQIALAARIATRHPQVGRRERARYPVVLLDEYQDTGHAQRELLQSLYGNGHPVTAVGDPCQSIYGWRGASAGGLRRFPEHFGTTEQPVPVQHLATSFRNAERILTVANGLAGPLRASDPDVPVLRPSQHGWGGGRVECALLETAAAEADWVADRIAAALVEGALVEGAPADGGPVAGGLAGPELIPGDVAVLCRKRSQFPLLRRALESRDIPVEVVGLGGLLTVPEVLDVISVLRILEDTTANDAVIRLLTGPRLRLGARDLVALGSRARQLARPEGGRPDVDDPVRQALGTSDDARLGSLVEALDDPGPAARYSPVGYARLRGFAEEIGQLRQRVDQPLPDLVADVERTVGLDVEVASRPGAEAISARADLDAFLDATAEFAGAEEEPTLRAFLAYLRAAEEEEFGLEMGRVGSGNSVKILTVHAAKGLEWPVVALPGLAAGGSSSLFPARPRASTQWTQNARLLPFPLRGDAADLPRLEGLGPASADAFQAACRERDQLEERRLAYVAVTRAARALFCSGHWWGEGTTRLGPSIFLTEICEIAAANGGLVAHWADEPPPDAPNPRRANPPTTRWPEPSAAATDENISAGARMVEAALSGALSRPATAAEGEAGDGQRAQLWAAEAELLLAARAVAASTTAGGARDVALPERLSVTQLVRLAGNPDGLARALRRPLPQRPTSTARRGTAFHAWLETHYGQLRLLDLDELAGAGDEGAAADEELTALQQAFQRSVWWSRTPVELEVPFDAQLAGVAIRGRMDAVFADPDGGWTVIDWKTGQQPSGAAATAAAVQLAAYRMAWATLRGGPVERVRAGFHYVRDNITVQPVDLLDADGLRRLLDALPWAEDQPGTRPAAEVTSG